MCQLSTQEKDKQYIAQTYLRRPVVISEGCGSMLRDDCGKEYVDFSSGIGANSLGFCDTAWANAVSAQAHTVQHTSNIFYSIPQTDLAEALCQQTSYDKVFFCNSGAEANECAIKLARKHGMEKFGSQCNQILTLRNSFHGRTVTTLSATGQDVYHQHFFPFTDGFSHVEANNIPELTEKLDDTICAVMVELIQGEGGVLPLDFEFVKSAEQLCRERSILLIVDEVQTGIGRTGSFLCCEQFGIHPDLITLAKGLGGGLPIGAVLMDKGISDVLGIGHHASTFGGNPVVCAGALEIVKRISSSKFLFDVQCKGDYLQNRLNRLPGVKSISGMGLMLGITLDERLNASDILQACIDAGLLLLTAKHKLRLLPPLNISVQELEHGLDVLESVLKRKMSEFGG